MLMIAHGYIVDYGPVVKATQGIIKFLIKLRNSRPKAQHTHCRVQSANALNCSQLAFFLCFGLFLSRRQFVFGFLSFEWNSQYNRAMYVQSRQKNKQKCTFWTDNFDRQSTTQYFFASTGAIWPKPNTQTSSNDFMTIRPTSFNFISVGESCDILTSALSRYKHMITVQLRTIRLRTSTPFNNKWKNVPEFLGEIDSLKVDLKSECEKMPYLGMDESCEFSCLGCWHNW